MPHLEVLICTINGGIERVVEHLSAPVPHVSYLISWQQTEGHPCTPPAALLTRKDVRITTLKGAGLSANRNHALTQAHGDLLLLSDDDVHYQPVHFERIFSNFEKYPEAQILTFQIIDEKGSLIKHYPTETYVYPHCPKGSYFSTIEIALRNHLSLPPLDLRYGLGAPFLTCGEEEVFLHSAHRQGCVIRYIPEVIGQTNKNTTGSRFLQDVKVRRSKGAVLYHLHGYWGALLRCIKYALRLHSKHKVTYFKDMYDGIQYIRKSRP